ncbi:cholesterol 7-desaturase nvd isoform X2 [Haematobia irritans]|uniref:cholesterol 7-desaturase nvd isoform X2 n=1 Tax=Haematobia irritans TaxID=7368 RepID=UPI003F4FB8AF
MDFIGSNYLLTWCSLKFDSNAGCFLQFCWLLVLLTGLIVLYWLFCVPCNWKKNLDDVGYDIALQAATRVNSLKKRDAINRIRKLRQVGINELPPPYPNGWYCILESSDLKLGEAKHVSVLGANIGIGGKVIGDTIQCPFHKWSFRGSDGICVNVPYSTCAPSTSKLRKWTSREVNDNIFIWYSADPDQIPWDIPSIEEITTKELTYHGRNEFYINCHIQEIPENGADLAHFKAIHNLSALAGGQNPNPIFLKAIGTHNWEAKWTPSSTKHMAVVTLKHSMKLSHFSLFQMDITGEQIGPSYVQLHLHSPSLGRIEILQTITPMGPMTQKVVHRFYAQRILAPLMKCVVFAESVMFERDITMWNHKVYRRKPQLVKEDTTILAFRKWFQQFYSENSRPFCDAKEYLEW